VATILIIYLTIKCPNISCILNIKTFKSKSGPIQECGDDFSGPEIGGRRHVPPWTLG